MRKTLFALTFLAATTLLSSFVLSAVSEIGKAGYYADSLNGRKTASGEKYDKTDLTCAHKSLPFGTKVRVTRIDNKKSVVVRVNDRGPFVEGYVVDISRAAAEAIGLIKDGVTRVQVEVVEAASTARVAAETDGNAKVFVARDNAKQNATSASKVVKSGKAVTYNSDPTPARLANTTGNATSELYQVSLQSPAKSGYGIQVSTMYDANNVLPELKKLQSLWQGKAMVLVEKNGNDISAYKLIVGPYADKNAADNQRKTAVKKGYKGSFVVSLNEM